jgi:hypothetical protein
MTNSPTEPRADMRVAAANLWQLYVALTNEGFDERQALTILGHVLANSKDEDGKS